MECGGLRVSELNPPHSARSGGVCRPSVKHQGKNLPEQESCIPTGRANAAALDPPRSPSPPFLHPFIRSIFGRSFFNFCSFWGLPGDPKNLQKSPKIDFGSLPFSELMHFMCFLTVFGLSWLILKMQNVCISLAGPTKYAFSPKMSFRSPGTDFEPILAAFWVPGGA